MSEEPICGFRNAYGEVCGKPPHDGAHGRWVKPELEAYPLSHPSIVRAMSYDDATVAIQRVIANALATSSRRDKWTSRADWIYMALREAGYEIVQPAPEETP